MKLSEYLYEKLNVLFLNLSAAAALAVFLKIAGLGNGEAGLVLAVWFLILAGTFTVEYARCKSRYQKMEQMLDGLDQKYLLFELLPKPSTRLEALYQEMLYAGSRAMAEEVAAERNARESYKEYIEEWIHEVKTPMTAIRLICDGHPSPEMKRIKRELKATEYLVEQALFYARSEVVEKDYFIRETELLSLVQQVVMEYRELLMERKIRIEIEQREAVVFTDEKWTVFILRQILSNAVKYAGEGKGGTDGKAKRAVIRIFMEPEEKTVRLVIEDNGRGIPVQDLPRVFEKGFTGSDRGKQKSTGLGLYLSKKLCGRLGLSIEIQSEEGVYTRVSICFPAALTTL